MPFRRRNRGFQSFSLIEFLSRPFRALRNKSGGGRHDHSMRQHSEGFSIVSLLTLPFRLLWALAVFMVQSWSSTRQIKPFLLGVPALGAIMILLAGIWLAVFLKEKRSVNASQMYYMMYTELAREPQTEMDTGDSALAIETTKTAYEDAKMFAEKLVTLKPDDPALKFQLAGARERCDDRAGALDIIKYLAPQGEPGYAPAHVWLARYYLGTELATMTDAEKDQIIESNLAAALKQEPNDHLALVTQALFHRVEASRAEKGSEAYKTELRAAADSLEKVLEGNMTMVQIQSIPTLVEVLIELGETDKAKSVVDENTKRVLPVARLNADHSEIWQTLVSCALKLDDYDQANEIITQGLQIAESQQARTDLQRMGAQVLLIQINKLNEKSKTEPEIYAQRLDLLCQAVARYPRDATVYRMLSQAVIDHADADFNKDWLRNSMIGNSNVAVVHILIGFDDIIAGDVPEGIEHWKIAKTQFPGASIVVYNLIDVILKDRPEKINNFLDVITLAIEMFPDHPLMYHARALYYQQNGQYEDAISDLKQVVEKLPEQSKVEKLIVKRRLVYCYRQNNQEQLAVQQDEEIESLLDEFEPTQRAALVTALDRMDNKIE